MLEKISEVVSGTFMVKKGDLYYCLRFHSNGWVAAEMVQFVDDLLKSKHPERAIVKYLGFTAEVTRKPPDRRADNWVEVDLDRRILETNSDLIRRTVSEGPDSFDDEVEAFSARRIYDILDQNDFTVRLSKG